MDASLHLVVMEQMTNKWHDNIFATAGEKRKNVGNLVFKGFTYLSIWNFSSVKYSNLTYILIEQENMENVFCNPLKIVMTEISLNSRCDALIK